MLVPELIVGPNADGAGLWDVFGGMCLGSFGASGGWIQAKIKLTLIPNMMYLSRV